MILVDTSIWASHLRVCDQTLQQLLEQGVVLCHPWVIGELALGRLSRHTELVDLLTGLPSATVATDAETLAFIERNQLTGAGIGYSTPNCSPQRG